VIAKKNHAFEEKEEELLVQRIQGALQEDSAQTKEEDEEGGRTHLFQVCLVVLFFSRCTNVCLSLFPPLFPSLPPLDSKVIEREWDPRKSVHNNLKDFALVSNPNKVVAAAAKKEEVENSFLRKKEEDGSLAKKARVAVILEAESQRILDKKMLKRKKDKKKTNNNNNNNNP
jgi:hypothetical protein